MPCIGAGCILAADLYVSGLPRSSAAVVPTWLTLLLMLWLAVHRYMLRGLHTYEDKNANSVFVCRLQVQYGKQSQELKRPATSTIADLKAEVSPPLHLFLIQDKQRCDPLQG